MRRTAQTGRYGGAAALAAGILSAGSPAVADGPSKEACVAGNEEAQDLQRAGRFQEERGQLATCMAETCPGAVREDCAARLLELDRLQPTIVFDAKDPLRRDAVAVRVTMDGKPFATILDGHALTVDPGPHTFAFEAVGGAVATVHLVIKEGEKARRERVVLAPPRSAAGSAVEATLAPEPHSASQTESPGETGAKGHSQQVAGLIVGGAGLVGLGLGGLFGLSASAKWSSAEDECGLPTACKNYHQAVTDHDSAASWATASDAALVAGGVLLAGGAALYFTAPAEDSGRSGRLMIAPRVGTTGATVVLRTSF